MLRSSVRLSALAGAVALSIGLVIAVDQELNQTQEQERI